MIKLGYDPNKVIITPPVLDNSKVVAKVENQQLHQAPVKIEPFIAPKITNLDEWSDFEDD